MQLKPINEQVVVVFGASTGIGRETAHRFAAQGAKVVVSARGEQGLQTLVDEIRARGGDALAIPADASHFDQVQAVADRAVSHYGRLDTWAHLAAVSLYARFMETTPEEFKQVIEVNLIGQAYGAMAALPHLKREGRGALIHITSIEARQPFPFQSAYAASKHGVAAFVEALRMELEHDNVPISVTNIMPATINTPLFDRARTRLGVKPMGMPPIYQPSIVADAILHAAEQPTRELVVGGAGKAIELAHRISPRLADAWLKRNAFSGQQTSEPKSADAPNALFEPVGEFNQIEGHFSDRAHRRSLYTSLAMRENVGRVVRATVVGAVAALALRTLRSSLPVRRA